MNIFRSGPLLILSLGLLSGLSSTVGARSIEAPHPEHQQKVDHHQKQKTFSQTPLGDELYLLQGEGGNIMVSRGSDGLVMIDSDYQKNVEALSESLQQWQEEVAYLINTHWHFDHTGSNAHIGSKGAKIIAHDSVRDMLSEEQELKFFNKIVPATPASGLPTLTFDSSMNLYVNDKKIELMHLPAGHTSGDVVISLPKQNLIHMGDLFFNGIFPFVDVEHGGRVAGIITNIDTVLATIDSKTRVIPGHGPLGAREDLVKFQQMLSGTHTEVKNMMAKGMKLKEIQAKGLSAQWQSWGAGFLNEEAWVSILFASITAES